MRRTNGAPSPVTLAWRFRAGVDNPFWTLKQIAIDSFQICSLVRQVYLVAHYRYFSPISLAAQNTIPPPINAGTIAKIAPTNNAPPYLAIIGKSASQVTTTKIAASGSTVQRTRGSQS